MAHSAWFAGAQKTRPWGSHPRCSVAPSRWSRALPQGTDALTTQPSPQSHLSRACLPTWGRDPMEQRRAILTGPQVLAHRAAWSCFAPRVLGGLSYVEETRELMEHRKGEGSVWGQVGPSASPTTLHQLGESHPKDPPAVPFQRVLPLLPGLPLSTSTPLALSTGPLSPKPRTLGGSTSLPG